MHTDVIDIIRAVGQQHDGPAAGRLEAGKGVVPRGPAVVPHDVMPVDVQDVPAEPDLEAGGGDDSAALFGGAEEGASGPVVSIAAATNRSMSLAVDRSAPAGAKVGRSQLATGFPSA